MEDKKPYLVIARKYRPQVFDEVVGQDAVITTLKNAITLGRIGHAYLFTGPRGVGKTSLARILAKALNCKEGPTPAPCGKCQVCLDIEQGRSLDVIEIDGASNRGIDEIRAIRENVKFAPAGCRFKVYIIDEVHQITHEGFNALLKTLEEPPAHVKFIFATTSAERVPVTILSRCQRFDFRRFPIALIASTLKEICKKEKIKADDGALALIAKFADGSLRDSQSLLEQIVACSRDKVTREDVVTSLGVPEEETLLELVDAVAARDAKTALLVVHRALGEGKDALVFTERLVEHVRNLLFARTSEELVELIDATETYRAALLTQKERLKSEELFYFYAVLSHTVQTMKRFEAKRVPLEVAVARLASRATLADLGELVDRLKDLEKKTGLIDWTPAVEPSAPAPAVRAQRPPAAPASEPAAPPAARRRREEKDADDEIPDVEELPGEDLTLEGPSAPRSDASFESVWPALISSLKSAKISVGTYLQEGEPRELSRGVAKIAFPERHSFHREYLETSENRRLIETHLAGLLEQQDVRVIFESVKDLGAARLETDAAEAPQAPREPDPALKAAMNIFGGRVTRT